MLRLASVSLGKDGYGLHVEDVPAWAWAADSLIGGINHAICAASKGWACPLCLSSRIPDRVFQIGWGWDAEYEMRRHSLGSLLFALGQHDGNFSYKRRREVYVRALTFDEVCEHFPDKRIEWDDDGEMCVRGVLIGPYIQEEHGRYGVIS